MAAEMNNSAPVSPESSIHLYMMGLDRVLTSMPINSDPTFKAALESKLMDLTVKYHLTLTSPSTGVKKLSEIQQEEALGGLSDMIIHMAVKGAIALKRSPIPGHNITTFGLAKAMELDEYYEVHQFFAELFYTGCTAVLQASKAYTEESTDDSQLSSIGMNGVMIPSPLRIEQ
ncbi:hypothetical protein BDB01DRAFT_717981 [Pilobolus umbonatus]|nr:hypothetical protein BDB01DRAFT_717981 [Pilobolus umbonatus]